MSMNTCFWCRKPIDDESDAIACDDCDKKKNKKISGSTFYLEENRHLRPRKYK